jgi:hypothetical protein
MNTLQIITNSEIVLLNHMPDSTGCVFIHGFWVAYEEKQRSSGCIYIVEGRELERRAVTKARDWPTHNLEPLQYLVDSANLLPHILLRQDKFRSHGQYQRLFIICNVTDINCCSTNFLKWKNWHDDVINLTIIHARFIAFKFLITRATRHPSDEQCGQGHGNSKLHIQLCNKWFLRKKLSVLRFKELGTNKSNSAP